jgi:hypothetical protein
VEALERLTLEAEAADRLADRLLRGGEVREAVVVSTCNRVEVYAAAASFHGGLAAIVDELHELWGFGPDEAAVDFAELGYVRHGLDAAAHAFRVAAGLDSLVAGEPQILGQLREAYETARDQIAGRRAQLTSALADAERLIASVPEDPSSLARGLLDDWEELPIDGRRAVLRQLVRGVVVAFAQRTARVWPVWESVLPRG